MTNDYSDILKTSVAGRYAHALVASAQNSGTLDRVKEDLCKIEDFRKKAPRVWTLLFNCGLDSKQTTATLKSFCQKLICSQQTLNFLLVIQKNKRSNLWYSIMENFEVFYNLQKKQKRVFVQSALPLTEEDKKSLVNSLQKIWHHNLIFDYTVRPDLKLGLVVESDNVKIDL